MQPKGCENGLRLSNSSELDCVRLAPSLYCETLNNENYGSNDNKETTYCDTFYTGLESGEET